MINNIWVENKPKRRQGLNLGKPLQGNANVSIASTNVKGSRGMEQGPLKEDQNFKASDFPRSFLIFIFYYGYTMGMHLYSLCISNAVFYPVDNNPWLILREIPWHDFSLLPF